MEATGRTPIRVQEIPDYPVEEYVNMAFSTPYNTYETQEEDENIDVYEPEDESQEEAQELVAEV